MAVAVFFCVYGFFGLSFTQLCGTLESITEALRGGNIAAAAADMDKAKREYDVMLSAIRACMEN